MAPAWSGPDSERGVVAEGSVGSRLLGGSRAFRYEVRCWRDGVIPDVASAAGRVDVPTDHWRSSRLLALAPSVPTWVWGRDELDVGDMWNSNSLISWLLRSSGHSIDALSPPNRGRAPGWTAGARLARSPDLAISSGLPDRIP